MLFGLISHNYGINSQHNRDSENEGGSSKAVQYAIKSCYEQVIFVGIDVEASFECSSEGVKRMKTSFLINSEKITRYH